ncbi:LytTR family transcriptional regulator [beta proteobacterium AAP99]|nr:LytTR family transcriptional regulator [beta proteobacterium AAP99]
MPHTALIADDEPHLVKYLQDKLAALWPELQIVATARNGVEAIKGIAEHAPTVAFLDIKMPGATGLEVAQGIETDTQVVFVTAYDQYAIEAFERDAADYLLKPVTDERLARTIDKLKRRLSEGAAAPDLSALLNQLTRVLPAAVGGAAAGGAAAPAQGEARKFLRWVRASRGDLTHQIAVGDVAYFESDDKYTVVHTTVGGEHLIRTALSELAAELDPEIYWQIHRGTLVNMAHVAGTRRDEASRLFVRMKPIGSGSSARTPELPVSRAYVHLFKQM